MMKMALPNGSLELKMVAMLEQAEIVLNRSHSRCHKALTNCQWMPEVCFMRPQHIPAAVEENFFQVGVCGRDLLIEYLCGQNSNRQDSLVVLKDLGFNRMSSGELSVVLVARDDDITASAGAVPSGVRIFSEYPNLTKRYFDTLGRKVDVVFSYGATEAEIGKRFRYGVCLTETGASLKANGLRVIEVLAKSSAVLISSKSALTSVWTASVLRLAALF